MLDQFSSPEQNKAYREMFTALFILDDINICD